MKNLDPSSHTHGAAGFAPDLGGFDLVSGFAFFVEVAAVDVVYYRNGEVLPLRIV